MDEHFAARAREIDDPGFVVIGGSNYGQGSSREHAALAPRYLGLRVVIAKSFARIHWQNLVNFGVLPLTFSDEADYDTLEQDDTLILEGIFDAIEAGRELTVQVSGKDHKVRLEHALSGRQIEMLRHGSLIGLVREEVA